MGYGDDLLITAFAAKIKKKYPERQIVIGNSKAGTAFYSRVWDHNPNIADCRNLSKDKPIHLIDYHSENRPYINHEKSTTSKMIWNNKFKPVPGEIYFSDNEISYAKSIVLDAKKFWFKNNEKNYRKIIFLETSSIKINNFQLSIKHQNKDWGYENWIHLVNKIKNDNLIIHSTHDETKIIEGIYSPKEMNFRTACAILKLSDLYIGPEGGFGHVAAALRKKAVLYFGGWISPDVIGYDFHENIYYDNDFSPCGEIDKLCSHCSDARKNITVEIFLKHITKALKD